MNDHDPHPARGVAQRPPAHPAYCRPLRCGTRQRGARRPQHAGAVRRLDQRQRLRDAQRRQLESDIRARAGARAPRIGSAVAPRPRAHGGYLLEVIHEKAPHAEADSVVRGRAAVDASTRGVQRRATSPHGGGLAAHASVCNAVAVRGELSAPLSRSNPFADLLGDLTPMPATPLHGAPSAAAPVDPLADLLPAAAGVASSSAACAPRTPPAPPPARLSDDFVPFAPPVPVAMPVRAVRSAPESISGGIFDDLIPSAAPTSIDQMFNLQAGDRDPLADFMVDAVTPRAGDAPRSAGRVLPSYVYPHQQRPGPLARARVVVRGGLHSVRVTSVGGGGWCRSRLSSRP
jgi:hypothetical protein